MSRLNTSERKTINDLKRNFRKYCKEHNCATCTLNSLGSDCFKAYIDSIVDNVVPEGEIEAKVALTMTNLKKTFEKAMARDLYIGIAKQLDGCDSPELLIVPPNNLEDKLKFIMLIYTNNLKYINDPNVKIVGFKAGKYCELTDLLNSELR